MATDTDPRATEMRRLKDEEGGGLLATDMQTFVASAQQLADLMNSRPPRAWDAAEDEAIRAEFRLDGEEARKRPTERLLVELYRMALDKIDELDEQIHGVLDESYRQDTTGWDQ